MSGKRLDDRSFWAGKGSKTSPFPEGCKTKTFMSAEGAGHEGTRYPDTTEAVHRDQKGGVSKIKSHGMKEGYRQ